MPTRVHSFSSTNSSIAPRCRYALAKLERITNCTLEHSRPLNSLVTLVIFATILLPVLGHAQSYADSTNRQQELAHALAILGTRLSQDSNVRTEDFDAAWNRLYYIYSNRNLAFRDPDLTQQWERIEDADSMCLRVLAKIAKIDQKEPTGLQVVVDSIGSDNSQRQKDDVDRDLAGIIISEVNKYLLEDEFRQKERELEDRISELEALDERLPKLNGSNPISVQYLPSWNGVYAADLIKLTNNSGSDLRNVPLLITIMPREGRPIVHVHYVSQWRNGSTLMATYPYEHSSYNNAEAINGPAMVEASLYLPIGTAKSSYALTQEQWDSLVQSYCESLKFRGSFLGPYVEDQSNVRQPPGMEFTFDGLSKLPVKKVTVTFWTGEKETKSLYWDVNSKLDPGRTYDYRSSLFEQGEGALGPGQSPVHIQFALEFEGTNFKKVETLY